MELFTAILNSTNSNGQLEYFANFLVCLMGFIWVVSSLGKAVDYNRWHTWSGFWFFTGLYYAFQLIAWPNDFWWVPFLFLDLSVFFLLWGFLKLQGFKDSPHLIALVLLVVATRVFDVLHVYYLPFELAYGHQLLIAIALLLWSWSHRIESPSNSLAIMIYALIQMPTLQILDLFGMETSLTADRFINLTFLAYFLSKFALIPASLSVVLKRD
ncbi:MAG: hypothetical protein R3332_00665 [Pseudohongiellaceae bacterium]|nr:hypothetical protein [Pseudohongiellaceae bacterium]